MTMVVDAHAHFVPQNFPLLPSGVSLAQWPAMQPLADGRARMVVDGKEFRVFEADYWDVPIRLANMDRDGISLQVMSPLPELLSYWLDTQTASAIAVHVNTSISAAVASAPHRLAGLGMLPLQDIALSREILSDIKLAGLRGIIIGSNINGVSAADKRFYPVYEQALAMNLAVFVHGYRHAGLERFVGSPLLGPICGPPQEAMAAVASFMMTDIFGKFPGLKLGFAHGGGTISAVIDRMNHVWHEFPEMQRSLKIPPRDYIRKFMFDTVTFSASYLRYLIDVFGDACLMAGSDGPTAIGQRGLKQFITAACNGDSSQAAKLLNGNAGRFFGLPI